MEKNRQSCEAEQSSMYAYIIGNGVQQVTELLTRMSEEDSEENAE
ncbi:hypothetical protein ADA01nite_42110 [Aneurinibacillus danicus]|uniref:Uncharacterized protein n=1 Tax=Aneurinibacillus danicus TaxID=267746 RepID=A0A511VE92_9BACL|nr:hypothetical protein ADA01nite_42110 [Aneurinibacillus danicus]